MQRLPLVRQRIEEHRKQFRGTQRSSVCEQLESPIILEDKMNISRRIFLNTASLGLLCTKARADLYDDYINSSSRQPFVSFFARDDTLTGHAFVSVGTELDNGFTVYALIRHLDGQPSRAADEAGIDGHGRIARQRNCVHGRGACYVC